VSTEDPIAAALADPVPARGLDAVSQAWVDGLRPSDARHEDCLARLHALLLRVARHEAFRRGAMLQLQGPELEDVAQQAADDSLMAIKAKIAEFRGHSRFTTWAYRFVMLEVSTKIGRHFWRNRPAEMDDDGWERLPDPLPVAPHQLAEQHEMLAALRRAITEDLTELQRRVFIAVALNEVPMDAFARELGSNRNAVYKALFDARCKLRLSLDTAGYPLAAREGAA
jgi:RNA polymerase sigma-70 factor, ECF subfamily